MLALLFTLLMIALLATGTLPPSPTGSLAACALALLVGLGARVGWSTWRLAQLRGGFEEALATSRALADDFEGEARQFQARHRPPQALAAALGHLEQWRQHLDEGDPLLLWEHIQGGLYTGSARARLAPLTEALLQESQEPMAFKTAIQRQREEALAEAGRKLDAALSRLEALGGAHLTERSRLPREGLWMTFAATAAWGLGAIMAP